MQQTSGANAPILNPAPSVPPLGPVVAPRPEEPRKRNRWVWVLLALIAVGASAWYYTKRQEKVASGQALMASVRTAVVGQGAVARTLRLTGVTAAEKYVSLIAPQLRGGRGQYSAANMLSGGGGTRQIQQAASAQTQSSPTPSNSGSGGGGSSSSSLGASASGGGATDSTAFSSGGGGARSVQNSVSRVGGGSRSSGGSGGSGSRSSSAPSSAMGSDGLGSTASALPGGGGGGGGGGGDRSSEFMLVLQDLTSPGSRVKSGARVAEFDRQYMLQRLDDYKAAVISAEASLRKQQADLSVVKAQHEQQIKAAKGDMDKAELDLKTLPVRGSIDSQKLQLAFEAAKAKYKQLLAEVKFLEIGQKAQNRSAEIDLAQTKIEARRSEQSADRMIAKAPIEGLIVMMSTFRSGEFGAIAQGDQLYPGQMYMQIVNPDSMVINATVNQSDVEEMRIGQRATVKFDAYPDLVLPAHIVTIGAMTKSGGFRQNFYKEIPVRLKLDKMDPRVIPDLSISADVTVERSEEASLVPLESIFYEGDTQSPKPGSKPYVYVKEAAGWRKRDIELGLKSFTHGVVKGGVKAGEEIALSAPEKPKDDSGGQTKG